jgi:general stress protein YciG
MPGDHVWFVAMTKKRPFDRAKHLRRIASAGGKASVKKYGKDRLRDIGRKGGATTAALIAEAKAAREAREK